MLVVIIITCWLKHYKLGMNTCGRFKGQQRWLLVGNVPTLVVHLVALGQGLDGWLGNVPTLVVHHVILGQGLDGGSSACCH